MLGEFDLDRDKAYRAIPSTPARRGEALERQGELPGTVSWR